MSWLLRRRCGRQPERFPGHNSLSVVRASDRAECRAAPRSRRWSRPEPPRVDSNCADRPPQCGPGDRVKGVEGPGTRRSYRPAESLARTPFLVIERAIPFELAHQFDQRLLPATGDEFLQGAGHRTLLGLFTA